MRSSCQTIVGLAVAILELALLATPARAAGEFSAKANVCAVAAGNEASGNTLNCYIGLTPEQLRIPTQSGRGFRFDVGHRSDLIPATIPR